MQNLIRSRYLVKLELHKNQILRYLTLIFFLSFFFPKQGISQGLLFNSNDKLIDERTSYNVFAKDQPAFYNSFLIDFDLSIVDPNSFGYIFSIKDKNTNTSYSLAYVNNAENSFQLKFNLDGVSNLLTIPLERKVLGARRWIGISIHFNAQKKEIEVSIDGTKYASKNYKFLNRIGPVIFFGKHKSVIDVPAMAIKNLVISERNNVYSFNFNESQGNNVYDTNGELYGKVDHPNWLINESYHWKQRFTAKYSDVSAISFDEKNQRFNIISSDSITFYSFRDNHIEKNKLNNASPVPLRLGTSFLDVEANRLYVYEVNDVLPGRSTMAWVDLDELSWNSQSLHELPQQRHHHNAIYFEEDKEFVIFGGFGNQRLTNEFNSYKLSEDEWEILNFAGDTISPRFFSGLVKTGKKEVLIFGGVGNETGDQSIGKTYYYDCYKVDFENKKIKKLWDIKQEANLASSRNMVLPQDSTSFYTLNYPEYIPSSALQLHQYNIKDGAFKILGDSIPIVSERIRTNANLYYNVETNELFCTVQEFDLNGANTVKIFSLANPPVSKTVINKFAVENSSSYFKTLLIIFIGVLLLALIVFLFAKKKKKQNRKKEQIKAVVTPNRSKTLRKELDRNAIWIYGDFKVFDGSAREITHLFSPKIKNLFILILINSWRKDPVGIHSKSIQNILWPEKPVDKVKNLKNVAINKLRKNIEGIDGLEIVYNQGLFSIAYNESFYCDFFTFENNLDVLRGETYSASVLDELDLITKKGRFMKSFDDFYFDKVKQDFEYNVLKVIPQQLKESYEAQDYERVVLFTNILSNLDSLNEIAFYYKIHTYLRLDLIVKAKKVYNSFIVEYKKVMDDDFPMTYQEVALEIPDDLIKS